jgi:hypothetical protein
VDYGDGSGPQPLALDAGSFALSHVYLQPGSYTVTVSVTDDDGDMGSDTLAVTVEHGPPSVVAPDDVTLAEGSVFNQTGTVSYTGSLADLSVTVDYGDGSGAQPLELASDGSYVLEHTYADDGTMLVTVAATNGVRSGSDTTSAVITNVAPTVSAGNDVALHQGETLAAPGAFGDPGADAWTATVDYGDGGGAQPLTLAPDGSFTLAHRYMAAGAFVVDVCVSDDEGDTGCDQLSVVVTAYTIFAGKDTCDGVDALEWTGNTSTVIGDVYANGSVKLTGLDNTINGDLGYRCTIKRTGSFTIGGGPDQATAVRPWPVERAAADFPCTFSRAGQFDLAKDGPWWVGGKQSSGQLQPGVYCATGANGVILLSTSDVTGTVTFVAASVRLTGNNLRLTPYLDGMLLFATGSATDAIKVTGSGVAWGGVLYAPSGGVQLTGSDGAGLPGQVVAWTVKLTGSGWQLGPRATP